MLFRSGDEMKEIIFFKANYRRHKGSFYGIFLLVLMIAIAVCTILSIWHNANVYTAKEMVRLGFGDLTAWTNKSEKDDLLLQELNTLEEVETVGVQELIYARYRINGVESDSEGQLIVYTPQQYPYKVFQDNLSGYKVGMEEEIGRAHV